MKSIVMGTLLLLAAGAPALADSANGNGALSLAALVAQHSPLVTPPNRILLDGYLNGFAGAPHPRGLVVNVAAAEVRCRTSNVDITSKSCSIRFANGASVNLNGRAAHELYATLVEIGVQSDGAAGSIYEAVSSLSCSIRADEVASRSGGGASCSFVTN